MRVLYLDCFAGISGDMFVGALLDLGADFDALNAALKRLGLSGYELNANSVVKKGIAGTKFDVVTDSEIHCHRHLKSIMSLIDDSPLSPYVKSYSKKVFDLLAVAEAKVHGTTPSQVHFHEVGAIDSIIDIVGTILCLEQLGIEKILCSPLPLGSGYIECAHGLIPLPAPATLELLRGMPIRATALEGETVTPTGAALVVGLCEEFTNLPSMKLEKVGYGAGTRDSLVPNMVRAVLGYVPDCPSTSYIAESVFVIETTIDDMNPELYDWVIEKAFAAGALDITLSSVHMKKNRPGQIITLLCAQQNIDALAEVIFKETTSLGLRFREESRLVLDRELTTLTSPYGPVKIKVGRSADNQSILNVAPEWSDCRQIAKKQGIPAKLVYDKIKNLAMNHFNVAD